MTAAPTSSALTSRGRCSCTQVMERNGDAIKPIWISEYAWISFPANLQQQLQSLAKPGRFSGQEYLGQERRRADAGPLARGGLRARAERMALDGRDVRVAPAQPDGVPLEPATYFAILNQDFTPRPAYMALQDYSKVVPSVPHAATQAPPERARLPCSLLPVRPLLSRLFRLLGLSVGAWARAALNRPRGLYMERHARHCPQRRRRHGPVGFFALYYSARNLPIIALGPGRLCPDRLLQTTGSPRPGRLLHSVLLVPQGLRQPAFPHCRNADPPGLCGASGPPRYSVLLTRPLGAPQQSGHCRPTRPKSLPHPHSSPSRTQFTRHQTHTPRRHCQRYQPPPSPVDGQPKT